LARYLKPRTFQLVLVVCAAILATLFNVISPKLLGDATSSLFASFTEGTGVQFGFLGRITMIWLDCICFLLSLRSCSNT
jgi:ATP-binding cassette subfamily B protein